MPSLPLDAETAQKSAVARAGSLSFGSLGGRAVLASLILVIVGAVIAPSTVSASAFLSMLPFIAILAVASVGQHLVILQRGLDISIAGTMSLAAVLVTRLPPAEAGTLDVLSYVGLALGMGLLVGAVNGVVITLIGVPALVTTIGVNSVLFGLALMVSGGVPSAAPPDLAHLAISLTLGVPNTIWVAILAAGTAIFVVDRTTIGRRFTAVAVSPATAFAVAIPMRLYRVATFMVAGLLYALSGVMLAGFLSIPNIFSGNDYILSSVAAVVISGNAVAGGARGSIFATVVGAFFLTFLGQLVLSADLDRSMQYVVEALIVIGGVGLARGQASVIRAAHG